MADDIFISYARADQARIGPLKERLEQAGISVWMDVSNIEGGMLWQKEIVEAIQGCKVLMLMLTPTSAASSNVFREVSLASEHNKPILPLVLKAAQVPEEMRYCLAGLQRIELPDEELETRWAVVMHALAHFGVQPAEPKSTPNNLPIIPTSFIGREREMQEIGRLLAKTRLLTLTGAGGCGKTRLALQVSAELQAGYPDGIWVVDLAPLSDPSLVPQTVASVLGVREEAGKEILQTLVEQIKTKQLLLLLDNCEHILESCAQLADALLRSCPGLRIMATSREVLGIAGETAYRVPLLSVPDSRQPFTRERMEEYEAVRLFIERATAALPTFSITDHNAAPVIHVCQRLDGIPLAIELAAARVRTMPVEQIETRLQLLTTGNRAALPRQQTLRATIDWSYDLLTEQERRLLRSLSVFAGGWTLEATEAVCTEDSVPDWNVVELLTGLVEKSLVVYDEQTERYRLLETIRQYSKDRLMESAEGESACQQHLKYFLQLAEMGEPKLEGAEQAEWLACLEVEHDNLRAALAYCRERTEAAEAGLRLAASLWRFWEVHGYLKEGREHLARALSQEGATGPTLARAKALNSAGNLAQDQGDYAAARALYEQSLAILQDLDIKGPVPGVLANLGNVAAATGDFADARRFLEQSLELRRNANDTWGIANTLTTLGNIALYQGDYVQADRLYAESLSLFQQIGHEEMTALVLGGRGGIALAMGQPEEARVLHQQSLGIYLKLGDKVHITIALQNLGETACQAGDYDLARKYYHQCMEIAREIGDNRSISELLICMADLEIMVEDVSAAQTILREGLRMLQQIGDRPGIARGMELQAYLEAAQGQKELAIHLFAAAEALRTSIGAPLPPYERDRYDRYVAELRASLGEKKFTALWNEGSTLSPEQTIVVIAKAT
ncbi:MAG TPA: tetratricopeptide repeat protein [Chthonomonadaceae bacterium]|nr:tetratricopeptide repeat protein [Chthonomonadaceae bacterium]